MTQPEQKNLGLVLEEELARQSEQEPEREQTQQQWSPALHAIIIPSKRPCLLQNLVAPVKSR
jgi:hypothetical protein